jgi:hypothetical protein
VEAFECRNDLGGRTSIMLALVQQTLIRMSRVKFTVSVDGIFMLTLLVALCMVVSFPLLVESMLFVDQKALIDDQHDSKTHHKTRTYVNLSFPLAFALSFLDVEFLMIVRFS